MKKDDILKYTIIIYLINLVIFVFAGFFERYTYYSLQYMGPSTEILTKPLFEAMKPLVESSLAILFILFTLHYLTDYIPWRKEP